jgi:alkylation response protein AidB-like acyl-CoA dehydrogenase
VFTSLADHADYIWVAVRTDPDVRKHRGISMVIIDRNLPGVEIVPNPTLGGMTVYTTFYENVRVPKSMRVGPENGGWKLITSQLNHERVSLFTAGILERFLDEVTVWAGETPTRDGGRVMDHPWVRANLARVRAGIDVLRLFNWRQAWNIENGELPHQEASAVKVFGSELYIETNRLLMEILGSVGILKNGSAGAILSGRMERFYRATLVLTFGGGANETQRDIIAWAGLRMPRPGR